MIKYSLGTKVPEVFAIFKEKYTVGTIKNNNLKNHTHTHTHTHAHTRTGTRTNISLLHKEDKHIFLATKNFYRESRCQELKN